MPNIETTIWHGISHTIRRMGLSPPLRLLAAFSDVMENRMRWNFGASDTANQCHTRVCSFAWIWRWRRSAQCKAHNFRTDKSNFITVELNDFSCFISMRLSSSALQSRAFSEIINVTILIFFCERLSHLLSIEWMKLVELRLKQNVLIFLTKVYIVHISHHARTSTLEFRGEIFLNSIVSNFISHTASLHIFTRLNILVHFHHSSFRRGIIKFLAFQHCWRTCAANPLMVVTCNDI